MKINSVSIIKHKLFKDVAVQINKPILRFKHKYVIRGTWLNMGFNRTYNINIKCNIDIPIEKLIDWEMCLQPQMDCIRYASWEGIK